MALCFSEQHVPVTCKRLLSLMKKRKLQQEWVPYASRPIPLNLNIMQMYVHGKGTGQPGGTCVCSQETQCFVPEEKKTGAV